MYIKFFKEISKSDTKIAGGKGASLGEMTNAEIPVPPGFVITTNTFLEFNNRSISEEFKIELFSAFDILKTERVAVRSSAVAEDSGSASWAGQLESYLNVSKDNLLDAVTKCWHSIKSERAKDYAKQQKVPDSDLTVAVVVQKMVNSEISGVIFTVNPVTNNKNEIMIETAYGLGELLVQGEITPDNYLIDKQTFVTTDCIIGTHEKMLTFKDGKNEIVPLPDSLKNKTVLNQNQVKELAKLGIKIENHYGFPCDIEWAFENENFYIVQSRPITTL